MKRYVLTIWQPDGPPPPDVDLDRITSDVDALIDDAKTAGVWVFNGGLHQADTATVLRPEGEEVLVTDGPYLEGKEHVGGLLVIDVPDLDAALEWGRRAAAVIGLPIEVRPFLHD
jgi:hypothetical protein